MQGFIEKYFGGRVIKTSIAAGLALFIASGLHFPGYTYSAIVAVLATQKSLSRSFGLSKYQLLSAIIGTIGGNLVAWQFGSHPLFGGLLIYLLFVIHLRLGWRDTILMSIVTGVNSLSTFQGEFLIHSLMQMLIVVIGVASSIVVNWIVVPKYDQRIEDLTARADGMLRGLLYLLHGNLNFSNQTLNQEVFTRQIEDVRKYIEEARHYAELVFEDHRVYNQTGRDAHKAIHTLQHMEFLLLHIRDLHKSLEKVEIWAESIPTIQRLLEVVIEVQLRVFSGRKVHYTMIDCAVQGTDRLFADMELPKNRLEFMTRASLYHFYESLKDYYEDLKLIGHQAQHPRNSERN